MSSAGAVSIQSARLSQIGVNRQVLKEGSSVLVRVIADRGNGKYEGSVAGVRVQLTSAKPLRSGDTFTATIGVKNGTIVVTPKDASGIAGMQGAEIALQFNEVSQTQLFSLLESLGLPADNLSSTVLQSFKQMGLKMDPALANKIRSLALRFGGKEKSAAEILSLLAQKGIEGDEEEIKNLLALLERSESELEGEKHNFPENQENQKDKLINRINSTDGAWYLLPFELVQLADIKEDEQDAREVLGSGCIRLLFDSSAALKLLNLSCDYNKRSYLFSLAYEGRKISNTYFNVSPLQGEPDVEAELVRLKTHFMAKGINPGKIAWAEKADIEGNASGLESFVSFGGEI